MKFKPVAFIINLAITLGIGALAASATAKSVKTWYPTLNKPGFQSARLVICAGMGESLHFDRDSGLSGLD